jgi:hypothetical protein
MTAVAGSSPQTLYIKGVSDTRHPNYNVLLSHIRHATREISRSTMTIVQYRNAARLLATLEHDDNPGMRIAPRDPRMHRKVVQAFVAFRRKLKRSAEPRIQETCEKALLALWAQRTGQRRPDTRTCLFTLSNFLPCWEPSVSDEFAALLPLIARSACSTPHRLIAGPVWLHELLASSWNNPDGSWYGFATDVPDGHPVRGLGPLVLCANDEELDLVAALWDDDPDSEFFDLANALEATRLL